MNGWVAAIPILGMLILGCTSPQGPAEVPSGLEVHVLDASTGRPLPHAWLMFTSTASLGTGERSVAVTDNDGIVHVPSLRTSEVRLQTMLIGYGRHDTTIVRSFDGAEPVTIALQPVAIDIGCGLVVTPRAIRQP